MPIANLHAFILGLVAEFSTTKQWAQINGQSILIYYLSYSPKTKFYSQLTHKKVLIQPGIKYNIVFIQAAIQKIPNKKTRKRSYNHKYTPHCTALHTGLKKLGHLIKLLKSNSISYLSHINSHILFINSKAKCNLNFLTSLDSDQIQIWLLHAQSIWKQIYHAYHLEYSLLLRQQINQASEKRCESFVTKPTQAINSILDYYKPPVHFTNIKLLNQLITDSTLIKQHIQSHFNNWTAYRPINQNLFNNFWYQQYHSLLHIKSE